MNSSTMAADIDSTVSSVMTTTVESIMNSTTSLLFDNPFRDMPLDSNFAWLLCALSCVCIWMIYGSCFHSRVIGFIVGTFLNQYFKRTGLGELRIGSLKFGVVSGRLAFRNLKYITEDYTFLVYDGYLSFRYWIPYTSKPLSEFKSESHRLFLHLYGVEYYYYNRKEPVSGLKQLNNSYENQLYRKIYGDSRSTRFPETKKSEQEQRSNEGKVTGYFSLRSLFPILDIKLSVFRIVLGNLRAPYSLVTGGSSATLTVTYDAASCEIDPFATVITGSLKNVEASFQQNPDFVGDYPTCPYDKSESKGKLKFFSTEVVQINKYFVDTPADINRPNTAEQLMKWSAELTLLGRTDMIYGGWFDARRAEVHRAVYPPSRSELPISKPLTQRLYSGFGLNVSTKSSVYCTIYLLNSREEVQKFILSCDPGTELHVSIPYILRDEGFTTTINLKVAHLRGVTSLSCKNLVEADELMLKTELQYSRVHHGPQDWNMNFLWSNASVFLLYEHKNMIADLISDWIPGAEKPDLLKFVPFSVEIDMKFKGFELVTYTSQYNWIDCSKGGLENTFLVFHGPFLKLGFELDFMDFLTTTNEIPFSLDAGHVDIKMYFPESHAQLYTIAALYRNANLETFSRKKLSGVAETAKPFRDVMPADALWCHTWSVQNFGMTLSYCYHTEALPILSEQHVLDVDKETDIEPDVMELEMSIGSCQLILSGAFAKVFYYGKENYFGSSQASNSLEINLTSRLEALLKKSLSLLQKPINAELKKRPLEVSVVGNFSDTTCHLLKPCEINDPPCPRVFAKTIVLEVLKRHEETTVQLLLSPTILTVPDKNITEYIDPMQNGQILVSHFQFRGHAMFSDVDIAPEEETIEYAWLMDIQVGDVVCRATMAQLETISAALQSLVLTITDTEDNLIHPDMFQLCLHSLAQPLCSNSSSSTLCPKMEDIKYKMTRFSIDSLHIYIVDKDSFAYFLLEPIWISMCNVGSSEHSGGLSLFIPNVEIKHFIWSHVTPLADQDVWMEATGLKLGLIEMDVGKQPHPNISNTDIQMAFLRKYDSSSHRLHFLWEEPNHGKSAACACLGGSDFFGRTFSASVWARISPFLDTSSIDNEPGLNIGQRIFESTDPLPEIVSLHSLLSSSKKDSQKNEKKKSTASLPFSPRPEASQRNSGVSERSREKDAWIPERRRASVGSFESFYSATEIPDESLTSEAIIANMPDILKNLDKTSVAAVSQTTISTISMIPDNIVKAPVAPVAVSFPVNLHSQLSKPTQESPLLMAGYVPQVPLWQRDIINVTIVTGDDSFVPQFYLPNFQKVKSGLDMNGSFKPRNSTSKPARAQLFPRHYRSGSSSQGSSKFVNFGVDKDIPVEPRSGKIDIRIVGNSDLMITPISCDALLPMIDSLSKHLTQLRPNDFLTSLYRNCVTSAQSVHTFDEEKVIIAKLYNNLRPSSSKSDILPADSRTNKASSKEAEQKISGSNSAADSNSTIKMDFKKPLMFGVPPGNFLFGEQPWVEKRLESVTYHFQMDQINLVTLQCGIVEEVVNTKDLSSPRDLICVSVITGSLRALSAAFSKRSAITSTSKIYVDRRGSRPLPTKDRKTLIEPMSPLSGIIDIPDVVGADSKTDVVSNSCLYVSASACHFQLRRLKHSEIWQKAHVTYINDNRSRTWFEYNPQQSPVDENSQYRNIFSDLSGMDQIGFIVLEIGVDDVKLEGGGRTETEELTDRTATPVVEPRPFEEQLGKSFSKAEVLKDVETDSRHSESSSHTFIAHPSEEDLHSSVNPEAAFKLLTTVGACWLNCPTPTKKKESDRAEVVATENDNRGFTRLDWHFLSTANPIVDAWLYPLDRVNVALKSMAADCHRNDIVFAAYFLILSVNEHILPKASKPKLAHQAIKSRVLQEDSCSRLSRIVQRHGLNLTLEDFAHDFAKESTPPLDILEKSIFILFKQLRYTPFARVLCETQYLFQKFRPVFRQVSREPGTLNSSVTGLVDDLDTTVLDCENDEMFYSGEDEPRKHLESPYPPLEQDLNAWLDEEKLKKPHSHRPAPKIPVREALEDSDSPCEDGEFGYGPGSEANLDLRFGPILSQLGLKKKGPLSFLKSMFSSHVSFTGSLDSLQIDLVESSGLDSPVTSSKETAGRITAFKCSQMTFIVEALMDVPFRSLDLFMPDYRDRFLVNHQSNNITVLMYKFDLAEVTHAVSMPLLRLLAQIKTVISNMQRVQTDLKKNWPEMDNKGHRKTDSTSTSGSGTSRSDSPGQSKMRGFETYADLIAPESSKHWKDLMMLMDLYAKPLEHQTVDETAARKASTGPSRVRGHRASVRKKKKNSGSDLMSSSGQDSEEMPESPVLRERKVHIEEECDVKNDIDESGKAAMNSPARIFMEATAKRRIQKFIRYGTTFAVSGVASIRNMTFEASLRGLNFQAGLSAVSLNHCFNHRDSRSNHLYESFCQLRTGQLSVQLNQKMGQKGQLYMGLGLGSSQIMLSSVLRNKKPLGQKSLCIRIGELHISVPHHPITLHSMVVRGAEDLADAIEDLKATAGIKLEQPTESKMEVPTDRPVESKRPAADHRQHENYHPTKTTLVLKKLTITAAPLPSLEASYEITKLWACGTMSHMILMHLDIGPQDLRFKSIGEDIESTAHVQLPSFYFKTSYEHIPPVKVRSTDGKILEFRDVRALCVTAKTGSPEYTFNTDALKYTVLFQKVFMKEIEDVLDTLSQPIASQPQFKIQLPRRKQNLPFFHQINAQQDGIRVTGTTPTSSALRLEIDKTAVYVSNIPKMDAIHTFEELNDSSVISVQVDLGICLGQLVQVEQEMYEEAKPDFQPCAHFRTRMTFTNYGEGPLEALLQGYDSRIKRKRIVSHLSQPRIYMQPRAVDMAVIFYINYKNAYDYWYEQRHGSATAAAVSPRDIRWKRTPSGHLPQVVAQRAIQSIQESIYVIELFISQMYVCMPFPTGKFSGTDRDVDSAALISLDRTKIRAVLAESIITSGSFDLFRLCFTEDRGPHYDYTGRPDGGFTNCCFVPKGYLEVTSRTIKKETSESGLPKWELYFKWDMNGIEMHIDPAIGKIISNLSDAMTLLTGEEEDPSAPVQKDADVFPAKDVKSRTRIMEKQMQIHAKIFNEMKSEGASVSEIQSEAEKLKKIEQGIVHELRKDLVNRIRQKSISRSSSEYRAHRRTSSTPQSDLSPTTPDDTNAGYSRNLSVDLGRPGSAPTPVSPGSSLVTSKKLGPILAKEEPPTSSRTCAPETEQAFDFDFTILINIESGHCTFYCGPEKESKRKTHLSNLQSASSADIHAGFTGMSPGRRGSDVNRRANLTPCCTLYIPGVNLEMQYESDVVGNSLRSSLSPDSQHSAVRPVRLLSKSTPGSPGSSAGMISAKKKGNFFATCSLESIPAETILTPQLLDFIEQALEPIPIMQRVNPPVDVRVGESAAENNSEEPWNLESAVDSFPVDIFVLFTMNSTKIRCSCLPVSKVEGVLTLPSLSMMLSTRKFNQGIGEIEASRARPENHPTGKSVLETLDEMLHNMGPDFRLPDLVEKYDEYLGLGLYGNLSGFSLVIFHPYGTVAESTYYDSAERPVKSGSSHLMPDKRELVRLDLDRLHIEIVRSKSVVDNFNCTGSPTETLGGANSIEFSALISIGKTTFWYDLRRLGEILAFPRAWYRRSIARRFFLGEETADTVSSESSSSSVNQEARDEDSDQDNLPTPTKESTDSPVSDEPIHPWKTMVMVGLKIAALDFNVNMGNVMGNTVLLVEDINCVGRFSAASDGHSDMFLTISTATLDLNSRGGVVGGSSQWRKTQVYGHVRNETSSPPMHSFGCMILTAESRLEYMGAVSALARMSKLNVRVRDTWALQMPPHREGYGGGPKLSTAVVCNWDQMQFIICSASTSHVVKSMVRITEFFDEQLKSSRQFISTLNFAGPVVGRRRSSLSKTRDQTTTESRFHRHWQIPLDFLRGYRLISVQSAPFPDRGGILKGDVQMNGRTISLACFYGNSFRGKQWARFSIREPKLSIITEAQQTIMKEEVNIEINQVMSFHLGKDELEPQAATVARVTCNNPPPLLNLPDWFEFMFMNSELDEISRFPSAYSTKVSALEDIKLSMTIETILALPKIGITLRSTQNQSEFLPPDSATPSVICNFTCDFGAPISVDMADSQAFYFLHQLINSYLANTDAESVGSKRGVPNPTEVLKEDARSFQVNEWYLQPSFKLLQRIGRDIETIGVERVMNRLGFSHAQTTIPKWIQRGLVDPVDKGFAALCLLFMKGSKHDRV